MIGMRGMFILLVSLAVASGVWAKEALITVEAKVRIRTTDQYMYQTVGQIEIWETDEKGKETIKKLASIPVTWITKSNGGVLYGKLDDVKVDLPTEGTIIARAVFTGKVSNKGGTFTEDSRPETLDKVMEKDNPKIRFNQLSIKAR